jgi:hypothetical protein
MTYSIALFCIMFVVIWIMHKPFDIHSSKTWVNKFHCILEDALIMQFMIILNEFLKGINSGNG